MHMITKTLTLNRFFIYTIILGTLLGFSSCSSHDDENNGEEGNGSEQVDKKHFFISVTGETSEYLMQTDNLENNDLSIRENVKQLELSGYTWVFNQAPSVAVRLIYSKGDPGIGLGYQLNSQGKLAEIGQFQVTTRFTSYGYFDNYLLSSVGGKTPVDEKGSALLDEEGNERTDAVSFNFININSGLTMQEKQLNTLNITGNGEQATLSGVIDMKDGTFLSSLVLSQPRDPEATGGSSTGVVTYPDSVWVAALDKDLNVKHIYRDDRISYSSGRMRSQYYSQMGKTTDGTVYVFSGSYEETTTKACGALRIKKGATEFDKDYYFNIQELSNGYKFRKVWPIVDNYFLLEFYNVLEIETMSPATQYAIVDVKNKILNWVEQIPNKDKIINTGIPMSYKGKMYLPITEEGMNPIVYIIDPNTAMANKGIAIHGATSINAIGYLD